MQESRGLTAEMYQAIVAIVDDRLREVRVTREGFDQLTQALSRLTEAQARTEGIREAARQAAAGPDAAARQEILDMLSRGEIDLEEAKRRLRGEQPAAQ